MSSSEDALLREQIAYYRARAGEYDEWFLRQGRYDHGPEANARWFAEVAQVRDALDAFHPSGDILELAAGTGLWTRQLTQTARHITAVDASPEVLALNRARLESAAARVAYLQADLFAWQPEQCYDAVFVGFFLSHVPAERFAGFWALVRAALAPGGRVFFVDSLYAETSTAADHLLEGREATAVTRRLNDGQEYRIVKVFYRRESLRLRLADLGWNCVVEQTEQYFLYGYGSPQ